MQKTEMLQQKLKAIDGRDYGAYQSLKGRYDFSFFELEILQIPKDPYAPAHTGVYQISVKRGDPLVVPFSSTLAIHQTAFCDFLARQFFKASEAYGQGQRGTGNSGLITIDQPGQAILPRNSVVLTDEKILVRCFVGLPARGRRIDGHTATSMLLKELPLIVERGLHQPHVDADLLQKHLEIAEDAQFLRSQLPVLGLVAFLANQSILPRQSGTSEKPLEAEKAVPFMSPQSLQVEIQLPNAGRISGMGIPRGVTLIVGGGYHGKSTLLQALELGVYNHVPGDGREFCVCVDSAVKVRADSGRFIEKTDISPFIDNLPFGQTASDFSTENASGSTSQAASIVEGLEAGAGVLVMDEDTCATNFMIRDQAMQRLVPKYDEPITPFIDQVRSLSEKCQVSSVLVLGGAGDYFEVADLVIQMKNYAPLDVTGKAKQIIDAGTCRRVSEGRSVSWDFSRRVVCPGSIDPSNAHGKFSVYAREVHMIHFGKYSVDLTDLEQLVDLSQTKALGFALAYASRYVDGRRSVPELVSKVMADIAAKGLDVLCDRASGHFAGFRAQELCAALNRLRSLQISQED